MSSTSSRSSRSIQYHLYSVWLFTFSDLKTIGIPQTAFGIITALSGPVLAENPQTDAFTIVCRLPFVAFWVWINLLPFCIDNQRRPEAIQEDGLNKPWRTMPSKRLTAEQAKTLMLASYTTALSASLYLGGVQQCIMLIFFGFCYNDLGGADKNPIVRNLINAFGYLSFASGAAIIASGQAQLNRVAYLWLSIIGAIVVTTVHLQDVYDQLGDRIRGRRTFSLVLGDWPTRWTIAVPVILWSFIAPAFWRFGMRGFILPVLLGGVISLRVLLARTLEGDKRTFKLWNLWMVVLYSMPLLKRYW